MPGASRSGPLTPGRPTADWQQALQQACGQPQRRAGTRRRRAQRQAGRPPALRPASARTARQPAPRLPPASTPRAPRPAPPTGCSTSPSQPAPTRWGGGLAPTCHWPVGRGLTAALSRLPAPGRQSGGGGLTPGPKSCSLVPCARPGWLARPPRAGAPTPTGAGRPAPTPTAPCAISRRSQSRRAEGLDHAPAERRWARLTTEALGPREWPVFGDLADAPPRVAS